MADPVVMPGHAAYTFDRLEDLFIPQPAGGGFSFQRTYYSRDEPWFGTNTSLSYPGGTILADVPPPFGLSRTSSAGTRSLRWTHNLFSFVDQTSNYGTAWVVRPPNGNHEEFARCSAADCWAPNWTANTPGQTNRLHRTASGFTYEQNDGKKYVYGAATADAGQYYLTELQAANGVPIAFVGYALPDPGCAALSSSGVPYVRDVTLASGQMLTFDYGATAGECVLTAIRSGTGKLVQYSYEGSAPGLLSEAITPEYVENFAYDGGFRVLRNGAVLIAHVQNGDAGASASNDPNGVYEYSDLSEVDTGPIAEGQAPCGAGAKPHARTVTDLAARSGDGGDVSAGFTQTLMFNTGYALSRHTAELWSKTDSCTAPYACSPGQVRWIRRAASGDGGYGDPTATCGTTNPAVPYATKDKRDNWLVTPQSYVTFDGGNVAYEVRAEWRGVPSTFSSGQSFPDAGPAGQNALETTDFSYSYNAGTQAPLTESRPSAIGSGMAVTTWRRDSNNRVLAQYQSGLTLALDGTQVQRVIGTLYAYNGAVLISQTGPCEVASTTSTSCLYANPPLTEFAFYAADGGLNGGRLQALSRYSSSSTTLTTTYGDYTALGEPGYVIDENGVRTDFEYEGHSVTRRAVLGADGGVTAEWLYDWDNEHLVSVKYPEGNYEAYCYRSGASPTSGCSGTWTGKLQKVSKSRFADGVTDWTEAIIYEYWADGTLKSETRYTNEAGVGAVARFARRYAADAHRRPTLAATGSSGVLAEPRGYDASDNLVARGTPYNVAPAFCRDSGGALSRLCAQMGYDRANRLRQLDLFADASSSTPTRACIDYDKRGNVSRVTTGCGASDSCSMETSGSTCGSSADLSHDYVTDDFGNVVEVRLSGTDNGSSGRGVFRFEYDPSGNVLRQQTEAQRSGNPTRHVLHAYDRLGRRTSTHEVWGGSTQHLVTRWSYDDDSSSIADPPAGCGVAPLRTKGRLRAVLEPYFTRWYQYDAEGRVTMEIRVRTGASTCAESANMVLGYTPNGNLASMRYGYGREVRYLYGDGGLTDREVAVTVGTYLSDGGVAQRTLLDAVKWEPYGGLRGYRMNFPLDGGSTASLERETGAASTTLASSCPTSAISETDDLTGRLRSIRVWDGATNLYRRTYIWRGEQVERINSCYKGGPDVISEVYSADAGSGFGYDGLGQVLGANGVTFDSNGGPMRQARYAYDSRGNLSDVRVTQWNHGYAFQYDGGTAARRDWLTSIISEGGGTGDRLDLQYDRDGRVVRTSGLVDSSGSAPALLLGYTSNNDDYLVLGPGADTVMSTSAREVASGWSSVFTYWYDASNRRQAKVYPLNDLADVFLYDLSHQLLEDRGNYSSSSGAPYPIDEYVWLGGTPVAVYRSKLDASLQHAVDDTGTCSRLGDGVACGVYFIVTDHIGKPVLALNGARKISGAGEYEPYGTVNRVQWWWGTSHPYTKGAEGAYWLTPFSQKELGMEVSFRAHFPLVDTEQTCTGIVREGPSLWNAPWGTMYEVIGGYNRGDTWSQWYTPPSTGNGWRNMSVGWGTLAGNCDPTNCSVACPQSSGQGWSYAGFTLREYEYRRFETGATPYFPPLRFPGQYHDEETDLNENQHRYYYPFGGRYLGLEPRLLPAATRDAQFVSRFGGRGLGLSNSERQEYFRAAIESLRRTPRGRAVLQESGLQESELRTMVLNAGSGSYSYARNNPLASFDEDGLAPKNYDECVTACNQAFVLCEVTALVACIPSTVAIEFCVPLYSMACTTSYGACRGHCGGMPHAKGCEHEVKK